MASITIRELDSEVDARLRRRAAAHGRNMEAEARALLSEAVRPRHLLREPYERSRPCSTELDIPEQPESAAVTITS